MAEALQPARLSTWKRWSLVLRQLLGQGRGRRQLAGIMVRVCVCACMRVCACACVRVRMCARAGVCVRGCVRPCGSCLSPANSLDKARRRSIQ